MTRPKIKKPTKLFVDASPMAETHITGIPHFTAELIKALDKHPENGNTFSLILLVAFDKRAKLERWNLQNTQIKNIPLPMRFLNLFWKYRILPPMDLLFGKGVYLFPNYKNWRLVRSKSLTYIHDLGYVRFPEFVQPKNLQFLQNGIQTWIKQSNIILTGSDHAKQEIEELLHVAAGKVVRIYHGVEHEEYRQYEAEMIDKVRADYNVPKNYIIYVSSFEPRKNLARLIEAYKQLPESLRQAYSLLLIGGGGWLNEELFAQIGRAQSEGYDIVRPNKYVEDKDLPVLIAGATVLVHPALYEGFGLSPLQAMACGVPVVVGDNSSLPEVVGDAGVLCNADDVADISAKIEKVLSDVSYRDILINKGLEQSENFNWSTAATELVEQVIRVTK